MAKGYSNKNLERVMEMVKPEPEQARKFITSRGIEVILHPVPPYLVQMATQSIQLPEVPTYEAKLEGGGVEVHKHDEVSISQSSDEEKEKWAEYKYSMIKANSEASDVILNVILLEGVEVDIPDIERLKRRMKLMNIQVPDDEDEQTLFYRKAYVIGSQRDAELIIKNVLELTQVTGEMLQTVEGSFRNTVESES